MAVPDIGFAGTGLGSPPLVDHCFHRTGVEGIGDRVVVSGCGNDAEVGAFIDRLLATRCAQTGVMSKVIPRLGVMDGLMCWLIMPTSAGTMSRVTSRSR